MSPPRSTALPTSRRATTTTGTTAIKEADWGGDWGPRKCDASTIPPIVARGVLIDVAAFKKVDVLPGHTAITAKDLKDTLAWEGVTLQPGDVVLVRTGTGRLWGDDGADHAKIAEHDSAGPDLAATALAGRGEGGDDGRLRHQRLRTRPGQARTRRGRPRPPLPAGRSRGAHRRVPQPRSPESEAKAYTFCYVATTNKIKGTAAGFALRPIALR